MFFNHNKIKIDVVRNESKRYKCMIISCKGHHGGCPLHPPWVICTRQKQFKIQIPQHKFRESLIFSFNVLAYPQIYAFMAIINEGK